MLARGFKTVGGLAFAGGLFAFGMLRPQAIPQLFSAPFVDPHKDQLAVTVALDIVPLPPVRVAKLNKSKSERHKIVSATAAPPPAFVPDRDGFGDIVASGRAWAVARRLRQTIPPELAGYFDLYLYVSTAAHGPWAQHMFIFHKDEDGRLIYEQTIPVSTGRNRPEKYFTSTPTGIFQLDPLRFERMHRSREWNGAPMPWAMFLDYILRGSPAGVALHGAPGSEARLLGHRASGGCIRLPTGEARRLFQRIRREEHGWVPVFALDDSQWSTNVEGITTRDAADRPLLTQGFKVLLLIQDDTGSRLEVAKLSSRLGGDSLRERVVTPQSPATQA